VSASSASVYISLVKGDKREIAQNYVTRCVIVKYLLSPLTREMPEGQRVPDLPNRKHPSYHFPISSPHKKSHCFDPVAFLFVL
jgi:hypothetical protein